MGNLGLLFHFCSDSYRQKVLHTFICILFPVLQTLSTVLLLTSFTDLFIARGGWRSV